MKPQLTATVIVPTSIDRGPLLQYSVGSILRQTDPALEVFVIGDGVHDVTRDAIRDLQRRDERVRFFDHPKGERRGERYRHEALQQATGRIVCYLCDRDLYFPDHIAEMSRLLTRADFAHVLPVRVEDEGYRFDPTIDLADDTQRGLAVASKHGMSLSFFGHTLAAYARLPGGWMPTPAGYFTDKYFSSRLIQMPDFALRSGYRATTLGFHRGSHPGWSTDKRLPELRAWSERLERRGEVERIREEISCQAHRLREDSARLLGHLVLVGARPISLRTPGRLLKLGLDRVVLWSAQRPGAPWFHPLRLLWRRIRYREKPSGAVRRPAPTR